MQAMEKSPPVGAAIPVAPNLRCVLAPNPSPMTYWGTNTYLLGKTSIAVIDPGPMSEAHLSAILNAVPAGGRITHICVTHAHLDHSPLAVALRDATGAPVLGFGRADAGRSDIMRILAQDGLIGGGEGVDAGFAPDQVLAHSDRISTSEWDIEALHTPGHIGNHMCFAAGDTLFSGDHVMGWASSLVSPPDGDLSDFMRSCHMLAERRWSTFYPGHGAPIATPNARLDWLVAHRLGREREILAALQAGPKSAEALARAIYTDVSPALLPAAMRNVLAHLIDLYGRDRVRPRDRLHAQAVFTLCDAAHFS